MARRETAETVATTLGGGAGLGGLVSSPKTECGGGVPPPHSVGGLPPTAEVCRWRWRFRNYIRGVMPPSITLDQDLKQSSRYCKLVGVARCQVK